MRSYHRLLLSNLAYCLRLILFLLSANDVGSIFLVQGSADGVDILVWDAGSPALMAVSDGPPVSMASYLTLRPPGRKWSDSIRTRSTGILSTYE